jgi:adenosine deaminase
VDQYALARNELGFSDPELAELARGSIRASRAPSDIRSTALADIDAWLAGPTSSA